MPLPLRTAPKTPCGADDEQDVADRLEGRGGDPLQRLARPAAPQAQQVVREQQRDRQGHERVAEELDHRAAGRRVQRDGREGRQQDQDQRGADDRQDRAQADRRLLRGHPGGTLFLGDGGLGLLGRLQHVLRDLHIEALSDPGRVHPGGQDGGYPDERAHQDHPAQVHVEESGGGDGARVRGQERVRHGETGEQRHRVQDDRLAGPLGGRVHDRREDEDADVEEDRDAEDDTGDAHGERRALLTEEVQQPGAQHLGAAGHFEDRAEHGAEADDDRDVAQDAAHARLDHRDGGGPLDRTEEFGDGEPGGEADGYGDAEQGDEGLDPDLDDQEEEECDTEGGDGEQPAGTAEYQEEAPGVGRGLRGCVGSEQHGGTSCSGHSGQRESRYGAPSGGRSRGRSAGRSAGHEGGAVPGGGG